MEKRLLTGNTVDDELQCRIDKEKYIYTKSDNRRGTVLCQKEPGIERWR